MEYWTAVLRRLKVKRVKDCSPDSGTLARVCLKEGMHCTAICRNHFHSGHPLRGRSSRVLCSRAHLPYRGGPAAFICLYGIRLPYREGLP